MPTPRKGESKEEFVSRAIKMMRMEGRPEKQAAAMAYSMWEDHKRKKG